jgi:hypothetical protein
MTFFIQMYLGDIGRATGLFILSGLFAYIVDYRFLKEKPEFEREKKFAKAGAYVYIIGGIVAFLTINILNWFA